MVKKDSEPQDLLHRVFPEATEGASTIDRQTAEVIGPEGLGALSVAGEVEVSDDAKVVRADKFFGMRGH